MSYRLIDSNAIAEKYPEVNDMPCVFADLLNGLDGSFIDVQPVVRCKDCKHYKQSAVEDRKMCFRKDIDGFSVCYEFEPNDWCSYAERRRR